MVPRHEPLPYATAMAGAPGLYVRIGRIGPLRPLNSRRGLDAFVMNAQDPAPGTLVPAFGARIPDGVNLGPSTVTITFGLRGPGPP